MTYLDTHAVIWLNQGNVEWLSKNAQRLIDRETDLRISPMVILELGLLHEIGRLRVAPDEIVTNVMVSTGCSVCDLPFEIVARQALTQSWTRDPFDRMIVAQARAHKAALLTMDEKMLEHYPELSIKPSGPNCVTL